MTWKNWFKRKIIEFLNNPPEEEKEKYLKNMIKAQEEAVEKILRLGVVQEIPEKLKNVALVEKDKYHYCPENLLLMKACVCMNCPILGTCRFEHSWAITGQCGNQMTGGFPISCSFLKAMRGEFNEKERGSTKERGELGGDIHNPDESLGI